MAGGVNWPPWMMNDGLQLLKWVQPSWVNTCISKLTKRIVEPDLVLIFVFV